jgi:aminoglycoside 6'-N-acetyltransferase
VDVGLWRPLTLKKMGWDDLDLVADWLGQPHVARWYLSASTIETELDDVRSSLGDHQPTEVLMVLDAGQPIGWCQWYRYAEYPEEAEGIGAGPDDVGIDYAIGDPQHVGRGLGTQLIAALVGYVRQRYPSAPVIADPEAGNVASRRILEKNGFLLVAERIVATEPSPGPMAIYRLAAHVDPTTPPLSG